MKVVLISATANSLAPIEEAFRRHAPDVEYVHLLDSDLLFQLERAGEMTSLIRNRFVDLVRLAEQSGADLIQLTCSAFNGLVPYLQELTKVRIFRSDQAVLDRALKYERVGLVSTVSATPIALSSYLKEKNPDVQIISEVEDGAIHLLSEGLKEEHDQKVIRLIRKIESRVDVIVLSQYSIEHITELVQSEVPILGAASATAQHVREYLEEKERHHLTRT
ncbi:hypothetical protein AV656_08150 [Bhargavaea cecembensis]|uniref:Asp/Glu/hydantoin racemase n=1 Tax=Bhargavaea cecembensis TaxID=394098 RepID=A0A161SM31_9BACL|nr:aspartate/glutamate racemase family protein [Bhargavaea cecembensis]KZE38863.1 hypothetical protein AV656_08150 [Bhargavaea cecembensis]